MAIVGMASASLLRERRQYPGPAPRALVEAREIVFLVRRMDAVVIEAEADQQRVDAEEPLEIGNDPDRAAGPDQQRLGAPFPRQRRTRGGKLRQVPVARD